jgi:enoyl-CoA hydratase/carnithine racemase
MMDLKHTHFEKDGNVGIITVTDGHTAKSLGAAAQVEVRAILEEVKADTTITLLFIKGAGNRSLVFNEMVNTDLDAKKRKPFRLGSTRRRRRQNKASGRKPEALGDDTQP